MKKRTFLLVTGVCISFAMSLYSFGANGAGSPGQGALWGAIAYSTATGSYGFSYNQESQADAINDAVERCTGDDCKAVVWFHNSCGAFAKGHGSAYGWGIDTDRDEAKEKALAACRTRGTQCRVVESVCTSRRDD